MPYSGPGNNPYWITVQNSGAGAGGAGVQSEQLSVAQLPVGATVSATAVAAYESSWTNSGGAATLSLEFYTAASAFISSQTVAFPNTMTGGVLYTASTTPAAVPANSGYAVAFVNQVGLPSSANLLQVYSAEVDQAGSPVNANYAFTYSYYPWQANGTGAQISWAWSPLIANDFDSLVIDNIIETMGGPGGVPSTIPGLIDSNGVGAAFRILAPPSLNTTGYGYEASYDLNAPQPTQDVVASMLLDGERPFGTRASNRTISLPIIIFGTKAGGMQQVYAAMEYLMQTIDQQFYQIKWTPTDTGLPMIFDCFRALPSTPLYGFNYNAGGSATQSAVGRPNCPVGMITLTIQAMPYGRSDVDGVQALQLANPLTGGNPGGSPVTVDTYTSVSGTGWSQDTFNGISGDSAHYQAPRPMKMPWAAAIYTKTGLNVNLVGIPTLSVYFGQAYDTQWPKDTKFVSNVTLEWTLTDVNGKTLKFSTAYKKVMWGESPSTPKWTTINAAIPQGQLGFAYNAVTGYSVNVSNWAGSGTVGYVRMHCWLNNLVANPQTIATATSPRATVYTAFGLAGTARSPISVQAQLPAESAKVLEITGPATGSFIVPPNVYQLTLAEGWGGGGAGSTCNLARVIGGGGGAGGEYAAQPSLSVVPGQQVPYAVGAGGLPAQLSPPVVQFTSPGLCHWTCPANVTVLRVECWGGGAAGAAGAGGGGGGEYAAENGLPLGIYNPPVTGISFGGLVPGTTYNIWVASGGAPDTGVTSADNSSRAGGTSWFGPPTAHLPENAYVVAHGGVSSLTGGSNGGYPGGSTGAYGSGQSTNTIRANGGAGGSSPGEAGGGGGGAGGATFASSNPTAAAVGNRGGQGGDSPASSSFGRWLGAGAAGLGSGSTVGGVGSVGGNGGAGASVPGFPSAGSQPGGGGGGGYTNPPFTASGQKNTTNPNVNYLGAAGGNGMVQLSYEVGNGLAVNGGITTFGSVATVGTPVTAHGGNSVSANSAVGAVGQTGASINATAFAGGNGGLYMGSAQGPYLGAPKTQTPNNLFLTMHSGSFSLAGGTYTSPAASASCAQGVSVALIESATPVTDMYVTDSAGNVYTPVAQQAGGPALSTGVTVYAFVANLLFPQTTATTLTVTSATLTLNCALLWYSSPWLVGGITAPNLETNNANSATANATFNIADGTSIQYELVVAVADGTPTFSTGAMSYYNRLWYNAAATNTVATATGGFGMAAWVGLNEGGANGVNMGDALNIPITGGAANWATISIPLLAANQDQAVIQMDWRTGTTPGAAPTTWINSASIDSVGTILVVGMCGSGSTITSGPSAVHDASGNVYTQQVSVNLPANGGNLWAYTAPVTAGLAQGVTGTYNWGHASATPNYWTSTYWLPNVSASTPAVTSNTGPSASAGLTWAPASASPDQLVITVIGNAVSAALSTGPPVTGGTNLVDQVPVTAYGETAAYLNASVYATQIIDTASTPVTGSYGSSEPWAAISLGFSPNTSFVDSVLSQGGGAAAGPNGPGYSAVWNYGAPGYTGGGRGGNGAQNLNSAGGAAAIPGGGGAGAWCNSSATEQLGGQGAPGMLRLTWNPPLKPFNTLVLHKPGDNASPNLSPICPIPITDIPNNTEYTIPSLIPGINAAFNSTYTILLANYSWDQPQNSRQVTVTINQYEYAGGPRSSVQATRALTPATDIVNGLCNLGEVTLPIKDYANYNDQSYFTVAINDTDTTDRFMDVMFLDTTGETVLINVAPGTPGYGTYVNFYIDEATPNIDLGFVGATVQDRQHQVSILDFTSVNGGPLYITPGDNMFLCWSPSGPPNLGIAYSPRWYLVRTQ